ncbi:MAG: (d)CMP kinase [Rikenellaceae bacterium]
MEQANKQIIIALDGYSSCGKSTFAKAIAAKLGYIFIDTGAMYRAVTLAAVRSGAFEGGEANVSQIEALLPMLDIRFAYNAQRGASDIYLGAERVEDEIRTMAVSERVSKVSSIAAVREKLVALQQKMGHEGGIVMDGRDIGTVVFPSAEIKLFMTAEPRVRAERRYAELQAKGATVSLEEIETNIMERDRADEERAISPLRKADDAIVLDNTYMSVEEQMEWFLRLYEERILQ